MRALKDASDQLDAHLEPLRAKLERTGRNRDDVHDVLLGLIDLVGVVNPAAALDGAGKLLGVWRRRRQRKRELDAVSMDRRIETHSASFDEAARIAASLTAVARADTPLVLVVDDAQWADPALVSLLGHLIQLDDVPVLIVTTSSPETLSAQGAAGVGTFGAWLTRVEREHPARLDRIKLNALPDEALGQIVLETARQTPPETVQKIAALASGNPLVLNLLLNLDVIRQDVSADGRIDTDPAALARLPSELRVLYQELWRQLPSPVRKVLALLAVQGPEFLPAVVERAAARLRLYDELVPALEAAREVHGWVRSVNADRFEFSERQRYEVAYDVLNETFGDEHQAVIRSAIVDHVVGLKALPGWRELDLRTRRLALESHIDLNEQLSEGAERDLEELGDSMVQLAALELDAGNFDAAVGLAESALGLFEKVGAGEAAIVQAKGVLGHALANAGRTDEAVSMLAAVIADRAPTEEKRVAEVAELIGDLQDDDGEPPAGEHPTDAEPEPATAGSDEWGRGPFQAWQPRSVPSLVDLPPSSVADLIVEVVAIEGPVLASRVFDMLRSASGASRQGRLIRTALDNGMRAAVRRGDLLTSQADAEGDSGRRVLRLPTQPEVRLRVSGDRNAWTIPPDELEELARRILIRDPRLTRTALKRRIAPLLGFKAYTVAFDELLESVLPRDLGGIDGEPEETESGPRWAAAYQALARLGQGEWTSVSDLAALVGSSAGWVARHLYARQPLPGLHRMLNRDGTPWRYLEEPVGVARDPVAVRAQLEAEGVRFDGDGRADPDQRVTALTLSSRLGREIDEAPPPVIETPSGVSAGWEAVYRAIDTLQAGEWTSFAELAVLASTTPAWTARHMYKQQRRPRMHRVLNRDGTPWRYLEDEQGAPRDAGEIRGQLAAEGVAFDADGRADERQRVSTETLATRLGQTAEGPNQPATG